MSVRRVTVKIAPELLQALITEGNRWTEREGVVSVSKGLPAGARFVRGWFDGQPGTHGLFVLLFEHESFAEVSEGNLYPEFDPVLTIHNPEVL